MQVVALIITAFNRPQYLSRCFESIMKADLSLISLISIVDDASTDLEAIRIIKEVEFKGPTVIKILKSENEGIKSGLLAWFKLSFDAGADIVINLDGDAIVRTDFAKVLLGLKEKFPDNIICGFNTTVKNRNPIIEEHDTYFKKKYASGMNMVINKEQFEKYIKPALLMPIGNWDFEASKLHEADGKAVIVSKPSVVQHIGLGESSMNHISASEPPDVADDFMDITVSDVREWKKQLGEMPVFDVETEKIKRAIAKQNGILRLSNVTLICADGFDLNRVIHAADISCRNIDFGAVKILSHLPSDDTRVIKVRPLLSKRDYSIFVMKEIVDYIDTPYFITIQGDGFILDGTKFNDDWFNYDYIGSPWHWYDDGMNVGNGAMSFRSKRLHQILKDDPTIIPTNDGIISDMQEDHNICRIYRDYLEQKYNILFAPIEVAERFGIEAWSVSPPKNKYNGQFGFHGFSVDFNNATLDYVPYKLPTRRII